MIKNQKYWEGKKVKFVKSKCIPMSLTGTIGQERDSWSAYYKKSYLAGGGATIESLLEWMDQKHEKVLQVMKLIDGRKR